MFILVVWTNPEIKIFFTPHFLHFKDKFFMFFKSPSILDWLLSLRISLIPTRITTVLQGVRLNSRTVGEMMPWGSWT